MVHDNPHNDACEVINLLLFILLRSDVMSVSVFPLMRVVDPI